MDSFQRDTYFINIEESNHDIKESMLQNKSIQSRGLKRTRALFALINFSPYKILKTKDEYKEDPYGNSLSIIKQYLKQDLLRKIDEYKNFNNQTVIELMPTESLKILGNKQIISKQYQQHLQNQKSSQITTKHPLNLLAWQQLFKISFLYPYLVKDNSDISNMIPKRNSCYSKFLSPIFNIQEKEVNDYKKLGLVSIHKQYQKKQRKLYFIVKPTKTLRVLLKNIFPNYKKIIQKERFHKKYQISSWILFIGLIILGIILPTEIGVPIILLGIIINLIGICVGTMYMIDKELDRDCQLFNRNKICQLLAKYHLSINGNTQFILFH